INTVRRASSSRNMNHIFTVHQAVCVSRGFIYGLYRSDLILEYEYKILKLSRLIIHRKYWISYLFFWNAMTESVRRRSSKWDLKEDPDHFPTEIRQGSGWSGRESRSEWKVSKGLNSHDPKWSSMEARSVSRNEGNSRWSSSLEPTSRNRGIEIYEFDKRDYNDMSRTMALDGDRSYSLSMSPGLDGWREKNRSRSPKGGWSRSHRSRSRSPPHGYRRDLEGSNGGRRSGSHICGEFAEERSIRGNSHRFLHQDIQDTYEHNGRRHPGRSPGRGGSKHEKGGIRNAYTEEQMDRPRDKISRGYEDVYHRDLEKSEILRSNNISSDRPCIDFLEGNCRKGSSCRYPHHGAPSEGRGIRVRDLDRKETTVFYGHDNKRESQRLCKFYAAGYCRNGDSCRFSHEGAARGSPEGRSRDDRRGHDLDHENRLQGGSKWSDKQPADSAYDGPDARSVTEKLVHHLSDENRSWGGPKWSDITDSHSAGNERRSSRGSKWSDRDAVPEEKSNVWGNDNVGEKIGVVDPRSKERSFNSQQSHLDNASRTWGGPSRDDKPIDFALHKSPQWISDNSGGSMGFEEPKGSGKFLASESMISTRDIEQYSLPINDSRGHNQDSQSHITNEMSIKIGKPDATQEVSAQPLSSFNMNIQSQTVLPTQPFNMNGGTQQQSSNPYSRTLPQHVEPIKKSDLVDPRLMLQQVTSGTSMMQNVSSNETVAQLTNLSASLAQIFGNGQHLPQLYAALNPSTSGLVSSHPIEPTQVIALQPLIQLNQTTPCEKQYDPINDSIDQTDVAGGGSQSPMKSIVPSSTAADPSGGDPPKISSLEEKVNASNELKQPEKVMDKKEETVQIDADGDGDGDNQGDEEGKKSKDPKGMRVFKFALVQFVKEILKPTWKEGQMSKEAHKTIVKKVVDKVTSTIQAAQIPQTQEKTDQYLSYSKPKLTKLVQAYVEKHSKT
ncbi:hypothetical protein C5167_032491, partial [Papaver somniferum]